MPSRVVKALVAAVVLSFSLPVLATSEGRQVVPEWTGREKTLRSGLRAGEVIQHVSYKVFFTRHVIVECFEGVEGFAIGLGWSETSIDGSRPVALRVDDHKPRILPALTYDDQHFVKMPSDSGQGVDIVSEFIRGLEVKFWTRNWHNVNIVQSYHLSGFTKALKQACGWHPVFAKAIIASRK